MPNITFGNVKSSTGNLTFYTAEPKMGHPNPVLLFIHGGLRYAKELLHWADQFEGIADVLFLDIPGHGRSNPIFPATLNHVVDKIVSGMNTALVGRDVVIVGESLGGLIALMIAGRDDISIVRAVIAADPPIATKKLLNVHITFQNIMPLIKDSLFMKEFAFDSLGISESGAEDRIYYPVFDQLKVPTTIIAGDQELFPLKPENANAILFDSVDQYIVERFYPEKLKVSRIANGNHLILVNQVEACRAHILSVLAEVAYSRGSKNS